VTHHVTAWNEEPVDTSTSYFIDNVPASCEAKNDKRHFGEYKTEPFDASSIYFIEYLLVSKNNVPASED
jgi:hypothetical protein